MKWRDAALGLAATIVIWQILAMLLGRNVFPPPTIVLVAGFFVVVSTLALRAYRSRPKGGLDGLIGEVGLVKQAIDPEGLVFIHGEYWRATSAEKIEPGERVEVEDARGLILKVKRAPARAF